MVDITEQKTLAERTATADMRLRDAIETISEAFVLWDADNRLVLCNSNFQNLHNLPDEPITPGTSYEDIVAAGRKHFIRTMARGCRARALSRRNSTTDAGCRSASAAPRTAAMSRSAPTSPKIKQHEEKLIESEKRLIGPSTICARSRRSTDPAARRPRREVCRPEGPRRGSQPGQVEVPRQHEP
ncbi:MAG: PAS-domain containing protein [Nitrospira sp.]